MRPKKNKILFVAMGNSSHSFRWINLVDREKYELSLFSSWYIPSIPVDYQYEGIKVWNLVDNRYKALSLLARILSKFSSKSEADIICFIQGWYLKLVINITKPDIIHSLHTQKSGHIVSHVKKNWKKDKKFPSWIHSVWGSDLYFWSRFEDESRRIKDTLSSIDYFIGEGERDKVMARKLGFKGEFCPCVPASGGIDLQGKVQMKIKPPLYIRLIRYCVSCVSRNSNAAIKKIAVYISPKRSKKVELKQNIVPTKRTSQRREITIKGYNYGVGRCQVALRALVRARDVLKGYRVNIILSEMQAEILEMYKLELGIPLKVIPFGPYKNILKLFSESRIAIGLSLSDGLPSSLLESMAYGAFPIQSNTSLANEWIENNKSGMIVPPEDPELIESAIRKAILDDELVDEAAKINKQTIEKRAVIEVVEAKANDIYNSIIEKKDKDIV